MKRSHEAAIVRAAPKFGGIDVLTSAEVYERFGMAPSAAYQALTRAVRRGLLVRTAPGCFQRAREDE